MRGRYQLFDNVTLWLLEFGVVVYEVFDSKYDNELIFALRSRLFSLKKKISGGNG